MKTLGTPVKFSGDGTSVRCAAPLLGQHTREVLASLGYSGTEIEALDREGAVLLAR